MPELPDLEVFKTNLLKRLKSARLIGTNVFNPMKVTMPANSSINELHGCELLDISRIGKELYFDFGGQKTVATHLMLSGKMAILPREKMAGTNFKIFSFDFEQESLLFSDMGSLCTVKYMPTPSNVPDVFDTKFSLEYFLSAARKKPRSNVKAFLIDQKILKGIGNAYADEVLWAARISPHSLIGKIPEDVLATLYGSIEVVLKNAIDSIRKITPDAISGEERSFLKVHNKTIRETETGHKIIIKRVVSKITYYTNEQVLYS
ncbi:MAG: hypothetical protein FWC73_07365 [Defluviitaleaceae bacterium]|nr:hypothetical protein [Defluviitaleaceae bacterium]